MKLLVSRFLPSTGKFDCSMSLQDGCTYNFIQDPWELKKSLASDVILDTRWESMKEVKTEHVKGDKEKLKFYEVLSTLKDDFQIPFSMRIKFQAHIFLCDGANLAESNCYWFLLQAWKGDINAIRKCRSGTIPILNNVYPTGDCSNKLAEVKTPEHYFSEGKWSHFKLVKRDDHIYLFNKTGEHKIQEFLELHDVNETISVTHMIIHSKEVNGLWKIHELEYIYTEKLNATLSFNLTTENMNEDLLCISMFLSMCQSCRLKIRITNGTAHSLNSTLFTPKNSGWSQFIFSRKLTNVTFPLQLRLTTDITTSRQGDKQFWAIDEVKQCNYEGYRFISSSEKAKCQLMSGENNKISFDEGTTDDDIDNICPEETISESCIPCSWLPFNKCEQIRICSKHKSGSTKCFCSAGYQSNSAYWPHSSASCYYDCPSGRYGHGCKKNCSSYCYDPNYCNKINGFCNNYSCKNDYAFPKCDIPQGIIFLNSPVVTSVGYSDANIIVNDFKITNAMKELPYFYTVQYKKSEDENWTNVNTYKIFNETGTFKINKLDADTAYLVRSVITDYNYTEFNHPHIPTTSFKTLCMELTESNFKTEISNTSITVTVDKPPTHDACKMEHYVILIAETNWKLRKNAKKIENLKPFTNYTLKIRINNLDKYNIPFQTKPGVPLQVQDLKAISRSSSSIFLEWKKPVAIYGIFKHYYIEYKHLYNLACGGPYAPNQSVNKHLKIRNNTVEIENLTPYSQYSFKVFAVNSEFRGKSNELEVETLSRNIIRKEEIPEMIKVDTNSQNAYITFRPVDCRKLGGMLTYVNVSVKCSVSWCENRTFLEVYSSHSPTITMKPLKPFVNYQMELNFCRNKILCSELVTSGNFTTKPTVPETIDQLEVYSKNKYSISLRWKSPYPPTGMLLNYLISYSVYNNNIYYNRHFTVIVNDTTLCKLWSELHCVKLNNLQMEKTYYITIRARNEYPENYGNSTLVYATTTIEPSEAPYDVNIVWTMENDLEMTWKHPNVSNGDISYFDVTVTDFQEITELFSVKKKVSEETYNLTYYQKINATEIPLKRQYKVKISAFNERNGHVFKKSFEGAPAIPELSTTPKISSNSNDTITVEISPIELKENSDNYNLILLISDRSKKTPLLLSRLENFSLHGLKIIFNCSLKNKPSELILTIGNETNRNYCQTVTENSSLQPGTKYNITVILINTFKNRNRYKNYSYAYTLGEYPISEETNLGLLALFLLLIPLVLIFYMKRHKIIEIKNEYLGNINSSHETLNPQDSARIPLSDLPKKESRSATTQKIKPQVPKEKPAVSKSAKTYSKSIKITDFEEYVKESIQNGEFERQHALFPRGQTKPWTCGSLKENKSKNRYNNLIAYDHSRVILEKISGDVHSDYINANYIDGYRIPKAYIATQGPKVSTLFDFWRMVWQENVKYITMLANTVEGGKKKVEKYWPAINESLKFNDITVTHISNKVYADFEHRIFHVSRKGETRQVEQLHFSSWPDHGIPLYSQSLVPFLQKMLKFPLNSKSPVVVHCSAGVGRTGTVLLCDICLRMAAREGMIDVLRNLQNLREQRANLVDNVEQYKLAHLVILECLVAMHTGIPCNEIGESVEKLIKDGRISIQMQYLKDTQWQDQAMKTVAQTYQEVAVVSEKNRFQDIIPEIQGRVFLTRNPVSDEASSYINAVKVDGFRCPGRFIVTQQPMPNTVGDFWRLVDEYNVSAVISLNEVNVEDRTCCHFWPTKTNPEMQPFNTIGLKHANTISREHYEVVSVHLNSVSRKEHHVVDIVSLKNWPPKITCPNRIEQFLTFWEEADSVCRKSNSVIVTCYDGVTASGLYVAMSFVIEKMKLEQVCDVCQAVRNIRHNRSQFVQDEEQFTFLYRAAVNYINSFQPYANFN